MILLALDAIAASDRRGSAGDRAFHLLRDLFQGSREFRQAAQLLVVHALQCAVADLFSSTPLKGHSTW